MIDLGGWGANAIGAFVRWGSFELRVARSVSRRMRRSGRRIDERALRHHLYQSKFISRVADPRERDVLREGIAVFAGDAEHGSELFEALEAAVMTRSSHGDAVGTSTVIITEQLRSISEALDTSPVGGEKTLDEQLTRMRGYRASAARELLSSWPAMARLIDALDSPRRDALISEWVEAEPPYFSHAPADVYAWLGDFAADIGLTTAAVHYISRAIDHGVHPVGFWVARRALLGEEGAEASKMIHQYKHPLLLAREKEEAGNSEAALAEVRAWRPSTVFESIFRDAITARADFFDRDYDGAIRAANRSRAMGSTAGVLWWAQAMMARETFASSELYKGDTAVALAGLLVHRDELREANLDNAEVVTLAATAARLMNDLGRAVALTTAVPEGEASAVEAAYPVVRAARALMLAENGNVDLAVEVARESGVSESVRGELKAAIAHHRGDVPEEITHTVAALEATDDPNLRGRLAYRLSLRGVVHSFVDEQDALGNEEFAKHLRLVAAAVNEEPGGLERLKAEALASGVLSVSLAEVFAMKGDSASELRSLENAAARTNDADLWLTVGTRQYADQLLTAAKQSLAAAVAASTPTWGALQRARGLQVEVSAALNDWPGAVSFAESLVRLRPNDPRALWTLIACSYFGGEVDSAVSVWRAHGEPTPQTRQDVVVWMGFCQAIPGFGSIEELGRLSKLWARDEEIMRNIVGLVMLPPKSNVDSDSPENLKPEDDSAPGILEGEAPEGDQPDASIRREILEAYFRDFPDGGIKQLSIDPSSDSLLQDLLDAIGERRDTSEFDEQVFSGTLPLGMATMIHGGSYLEAIISCASGVRFAGNGPIESDVLAELISGAEIVADTTAVYALTKLPIELSSKLIGALDRLSVSDGQFRDAVNGLQQVSRFGHAGPNVRRARGPVARRIRADVSDDRANAAAVVAAMRRYTRLPPIPSFGSEMAGEEISAAAWFGAVAAAGTDRVLWADDYALRGAAQSIGTRAFSTIDLVSLLSLRGRLTAQEVTAIHAVLLRERYKGIEFEVDTYSAAFEATAANALAMASLVESGIQGDANEIVEYTMVCAGALSANPFALEAWIAAVSRWLLDVAPDLDSAKSNLALLTRRICQSVWLVQTTFPFIDSGMQQGLDYRDDMDPLLAEIGARFRRHAASDRAGAAQYLLGLTAGVDPAQRLRYTALALS